MFAQDKQSVPLPARVVSGKPMQTKIYIITLGIFLTLLLAASTASSQPYYFFKGDADNKVYKLNLATGQLECFVPQDTILQGNISFINWDPQQRWVYVIYGRGGGSTAINVNDSTIMGPLPPDSMGGDEVEGIVYLPHQNKFYATWSDQTGDTSYVRRAWIFDGTTFAPVDTLNYGGFAMFGAENENIVSLYGDSIYVIEGPRRGQDWNLNIFSTITRSVIKAKTANDFFPYGVYKYAADFRRGIFLYGYYYPDSLGGSDRTYNSLADTVSSTIARLIMGREFLSGDAKYVVLAEKISSAVYSGTAYVFASATGKLTQKAYFPSGGDFYVFDNVPDTIYYIIKDSTGNVTARNHIYKLSLSASPTPVNNLLDTLVSLRTMVAQQGWLGNIAFGSQLDSLLTNARTDLLRGDSLNCAKFVKTFQDTVRYYLLNPTSGKFVKRMGDKQLYSNAQYILDALPPLR